MNKKTRDKIQKHFGVGAMFNTKTKYPISWVITASHVMGDMNQERFWNSIIQKKIDQEGKNETN